MPVQQKRLPEWLHTRIPERSTRDTEHIVTQFNLNTVCSSARCPNRAECYSKKRATFLIMGSVCVRNCGFCSVASGDSRDIDPCEAANVASAACLLELKHVVITSVTRDDLPDGGARHFVNTVTEIKKKLPHATIEVLVPDFCGMASSVDLVAGAPIDIFNHNIETVPRLYDLVRPRAEYLRSLGILSHVKLKYPQIYTKSGLMVGLGESDDEICTVLDDLSAARCDIVTIGQYLKPMEGKAEVVRFVRPEDFAKYAKYAYTIGIKYVSADPLVRSSYNSEEVYSLIHNRQFNR